MTAPMLVWDQEGEAPEFAGTTLYWRSSAHAAGISVPRYLEDHAERFRAKYLTFVHDLGQAKVAGTRVVDHLALNDGFSFWWMTLPAEKSPYKSPKIYGCLRLLALEELVLEQKPGTLRLVSSDRDLAEAVRVMCRTLNVDFDWQASSPPPRRPSLRAMYRVLPFWLQGLIYLTRHLFERWPVRRLEKPKWHSGDDAVFVCSFFDHLDQTACAAGQFVSRQWGALPHRLNDHGRRMNWLHHLLFGLEAPQARVGMSWLRRFNADADRQGAHAFLDSYLSPRIVARAVRHWVWLSVVGVRLRNISAGAVPKGSAVWLWPFLRDDWRASIEGGKAIENCLWVELFDAALQDVPPQRMGLYLWENQGWERALIHAWRKHGHGRIVGYAHATVPFWHLYYFEDPRAFRPEAVSGMPMPDSFAVNGPVAWRLLNEAGYPAERLVEVEALRYLDLSPKTSRQAADPLRIKTLIVGDTQPDSMRSLMTILAGAIKKLPREWDFVFKPHPRYAVELSDYPGLEAVGRTHEPLDQILDDFDVVLAANGTSAAVDAYQSRLPVVIGLDGSDLNLSPLRGQPGARFVGTTEELTEALLAAGRDVASEIGRAGFFFRDPELPRWRKLLS